MRQKLSESQAAVSNVKKLFTTGLLDKTAARKIDKETD